METIISILALPVVLVAMVIDWLNSIVIATIQVVNALVKIIGVVVRSVSAVVTGFGSESVSAQALADSLGVGSSGSHITVFVEGVSRVWSAVPSALWVVIMSMFAVGIVVEWIRNHAAGSNS